MTVFLYQRIPDIICSACFHLTEAETTQEVEERRNGMNTAQVIGMDPTNGKTFQQDRKTHKV